MRKWHALWAILCMFPAAAAEDKPSPNPQDDSKNGASETSFWSFELTYRDVGLGLGSARHIDGLRINIIDPEGFEYVVHGVNLTAWMPTKKFGGNVTGLALGLPVTGMEKLTGIGLGLGLGFGDSVHGAAPGILGTGTAETSRVLPCQALGYGLGGSLHGLGIGLGGGSVGQFTG